MPDSVSSYEWGDCRVEVTDAGGKLIEMVLQTALGKIVQTVRSGAPRYEPKSLHECDFWSGDGTSYPLVSMRFHTGLPAEAEDGEPADLGELVSVAKAVVPALGQA